MTNDKEMNEDFEKSGSVFPKVSPEQIDELMGQVVYKPSLIEGTTTTLVVSVLPIAGVDFTLATTTMGCIDKRNFNAEKGVKYCTEKCEGETRNKLWELEGYHLAKTLEVKPDNSTFVERMQVELSDLVAKAQALFAFFDSDLYNSLSLEQQTDLDQQYGAMSNYAAILEKRIKKATVVL